MWAPEITSTPAVGGPTGHQESPSASRGRPRWTLWDSPAAASTTAPSPSGGILASKASQGVSPAGVEMISGTHSRAKGYIDTFVGGGALSATGQAGMGAAIAAIALFALASPALDETVAHAQTVETIAGTTHAPDACIVEAASQTGTTAIAELPCGITLDGRTHTPSLPWNFAVGTHTVTWSWTDNGRTLTETQAIIVIDRAPPKIVPPPTETIGIDSGSTVAVPQATIDKVARDSNDRPPTKQKPTITHSPQALSVGAHKLVWIATDEAERRSTATQWVKVVDNVAPTIVRCLPDVEVQSQAAVPSSRVELGAFTENDVNDNITPFDDLMIESNRDALIGDAKEYPLGETTLTWTVMDSGGNRAECVQRVHVLDLKVLKTLPDGAGAAGTGFGHSLVTDGKLLFVGNPEYNHVPEDGSETKTESGEVVAYLLKESGGKKKYSLEDTVSPEEPDSDMRFGESMAILSGTPDDILAVGAPGDGNHAGAVHLYNARTLNFLRSIPNPDSTPTNPGHFGASLAALGNKLVVGAYKHSIGQYVEAGRVHVYSSSGTKMYHIDAPDPSSADRFGLQVDASVENMKELIYVSSRYDKKTGTRGAVYIYDATGATTADDLEDPEKALSPSGTADTDYAEDQIRAVAGGGVFAGETYVTTPGSAASEGRIHLHSSTGAKTHTVDPQPLYKSSFGTAFDVGDGLLYAPNYASRGQGPLVAFDATNLEMRGKFTYYPESDLTTKKAGSVVEAIGDNMVVVTETLESTDRLTQKTRVHVLDLRGISAPPPGPPPASGSNDAQSQAQVQAPRPAEPQLSEALVAPTLLSTERAGSNGVKLTYNVAISPFEVSIGDYEMADEGLRIVDVDVSGSVVIITYAGSPKGAAAGTPEVEMVGGIGHY